MNTKGNHSVKTMWGLSQVTLPSKNKQNKTKQNTKPKPNQTETTNRQNKATNHSVFLATHYYLTNILMWMFVHNKINKITGMAHLEVTVRKFVSSQLLVLGERMFN